MTASHTGFTAEVRLCDDAGMVSDAPVKAGSPGTILDPELTYRKLLNNLRGHTGLPAYTGEPFPCTGTGHLAGEHFRCTNPIHTLRKEDDHLVRNPTFLRGVAVIEGSGDHP